MSVWEALILGIVQGVCEFLPISSSGHLLLLQKLMGISESSGGPFFSVMLHVATLVAVIIVYRKRVWALVRHPIQKLMGYLIVATVPTVLIALLFKVDPFETFYNNAEGGSYLGVCFLVTTILLLLCDWAATYVENKRKLGKMTWRDSLIIGGMQCLGVLPGVSRSGSTISGAMFAGLDRKAAADFSFLMSIPAILGGMVLEVKDVIEVGSIGVDIGTLLVGMIAAGVTGYFAVRLMLKLITGHKLWGFAVYTGVLGIITIILQLLGKI